MLRIGDAEPHGDRQPSPACPFADARDQSRRTIGNVFALAGNAGAGDGVDESLAVLGDGGKALIRAGGRSKEDRREADAVHLGEVGRGFFDDHVRQQDTVDAGGSGCVGEVGQAEAQDGIEIGKDHQAGMGTGGAQIAGQGKHVYETGTAREGAFTGALDDRAIGERIAEGNAELDDVRAGIDGSESDGAGDAQVRRLRAGGLPGMEAFIARGEIDDEAGMLLEMEWPSESSMGCVFYAP